MVKKTNLKNKEDVSLCSPNFTIGHHKHLETPPKIKGDKMREQKEIQKGKNYQISWFDTGQGLYELWKNKSPDFHDYGIDLIFFEGTGIHIKFSSVEDVHKVAKIAGIKHYSIWEEIGSDWKTKTRVFITEDLDAVQELVKERSEKQAIEKVRRMEEAKAIEKAKEEYEKTKEIK